MALILSQYNMVGPLCHSPFSSSNFLSHKAWSLALVIAMYSTSIDDSATFVCFLELQVISPDQRLKQFPNVDFLSCMLLP